MYVLPPFNAEAITLVCVITGEVTISRADLKYLYKTK